MLGFSRDKRHLIRSQPISSKPRVIYARKSSAGAACGIAGAVFAILGIVGLAILFLPFAILFSVVSLFRVASQPNASGIVAALVSWILTIIAVIVSPSAWLAVLALLGASH